MLPWAHAATGYILYALYTRRRYGHHPVGFAVLAAGFGTQIPDLIDKPLTWTLPVLPYGRSLAHSAITLVVVLTVLWIKFSYADQRQLTVAFGLGYASHLFGDAVGPVLNGDWLALGYLLWPVTPVPEPHTESFLSFLTALDPTPLMLAGSITTVAGISLWASHGYPGVADLLRDPHPDPETGTETDPGRVK
ncbi:metal-dependent hydrolase [Halobellus sp. EA9]|uniref:metal-dependent hydrolase n=1 Tax=Halobellus sp. EA9 TaxID=3421647 RepID=UPI003EB96C73